jgi:alpha-galactosidase
VSKKTNDATLHKSTAGAYTDITAGYQDIRYTSGKTVYYEGLVDGRWVNRYWQPDGRFLSPSEINMFLSPGQDAFRVGIDGEILNTGWTLMERKEFPRIESGFRHEVVELSNLNRPIMVEVHTILDGTPVLVRWLKITNKGEKTVSLSDVSPWSGRLWNGTAGDRQALSPLGLKMIQEAGGSRHDFTAGGTFSMSGRTEAGHEGWFDWHALAPGEKFAYYGLDGTGWDDPFFIARSENFGQYFICQLAWSANYHILLDASWGLNFAIGPQAYDPRLGDKDPPILRTIDPGETIVTPEVHLGFVEGDLDTAVQAMHDHVRLSAPARFPAGRESRVAYEVPGDAPGFSTQQNQAILFEQIDLAAAIGAETFILGGGAQAGAWYDRQGDWWVTSRFENGIAPIKEYAAKKGLLLGMYLTPEHLPIQAKVSVEHPDWLLQGEDQNPRILRDKICPGDPYGPYRILNLTKPEAARYMEKDLCRVIDEYQIDALVIDFNPCPTGTGPWFKRSGFKEDFWWRYYEGAYGVYDHIRNKYPNLTMYQCAAGGARLDLGMAERWQLSYLTDASYIPPFLQDFSGISLVLPPERIINCNGWWSVQERGQLDTFLRASFCIMTPHLLQGTAPTLESMNPLTLERFIHFSKLFKRFMRPLLGTCRMYHHEPTNAFGGVDSSPWFAMEYGTPDKSKGWALIVRLSPGGPDINVFKPRGLAPTRIYRVTFDSLDESVLISGLSLIRDGLPLRLESAKSSELLLFEQE